MPDSNRYENGLERGPANHTALTPCDFMARAAAIYPTRTAVVHGALRRSYAETYDRCRRLAGALLERGVGLGDTVSIMAPNVPAMLEAHFGVPMAGAVLNALNIRLDAASVAWMLNHARSRVLIADAAFASIVEEALAQLDRRPHMVTIDDPAEADGRGGASATRATRRCSPPERRISSGPGPMTSGRRSRSITHQARRAGRRGSCITTAAPT